ncbi:type I pullulanase [Roseivirga pacifica]|nr:type I pullulanase [Roseivirga pacifica]MCO6367811.1 type I pullulanase [Roseivirga pacifica]MCO6369658.1 type I pullulanase [Roseivirga pacifica]MCO6373512.1 type I pullulanase [Roseivirga pacifica]MCO6377183.1 type I pullulanase [Roseivirga pacifica]
MKMKAFKTILGLTLLFMAMACNTTPTYETLEDYPIYDGNDLGMTYTPASTQLKIWSPAAQSVKVKLYEKGDGDNLIDEFKMKRDKQGVWSYKLKGDHAGEYYTYQVQQNGQWLQEKPDLYAVAVGVNGQRSMIIDLKNTNPEGWEEDQKPALANYNDIIIYELQIRDVSISPNSGITQKGKYAGLVEAGTKSPEGLSTGLDHIKDLGVTHVHLLPTFDHRSIDETKLDEPQYNWGYDPLNYNVPEGSFSTDPYDGAVRIKEFKQMVKTLHENGIRVILDVVYNHTGQTEDSNFNQLVPDYYYRQNAEGGFSDASACGNETASERAMMRKYIIESVAYWAKEYHLDGFRFDLMGIHDIETMNEVSRTLREIDPSIFVYGEGWTAGSSPLPQEEQALKANTYKLEQVAAFSDDLRDGLKGSVFEETEGGFVSQTTGLKESIKFGIVASTQHPQVNYDSVNYSNAPWAAEPYQTISYVSCHDNNTLWDKLLLSRPDASEAERIKMHKLAETIVLTSQGVPFIHAGMEMLRSKDGVENSYESPDSINQIDWSRKAQYKEVYEYYKGIIALRKAHPAFRMASTKDIQAHLEFLDYTGDNFIGYRLKDNANGDEWEEILVLLNGADTNRTISLPAGNWTLVADGSKVLESGIRKPSSKILTVPGITAYILKKG